MAKTLKYGEIFLYAKHGETYEIIDSTVIQAIGEKVTMKETPDGNIIMKKEGTHTSTDTDDIIKPYGAFTGATYKKVEEYKKVKLGHALDALNEGVQNVFVKEEYFDGSHAYVEIHTDSYLENVDIYDFDDLMKKDFYILK